MSRLHCHYEDTNGARYYHYDQHIHFWMCNSADASPTEIGITIRSTKARGFAIKSSIVKTSDQCSVDYRGDVSVYAPGALFSHRARSITFEGCDLSALIEHAEKLITQEITVLELTA